MSSDATTPRIGHVIDADARRDAVHIAVLPMLATRTMRPGEPLQSGIVDPFLQELVRPGEWYYLFLYPNTITSLRHSWSHPAFPDEPEPAPARRSEATVWAERDVLSDWRKLNGNEVPQ